MRRISVIVPTRDRPALLAEAVVSVAAQTHRDWQLIVVDDGSAMPVDAAALRAAAGREVTLLRQEQPLGQATSRERAAPFVNGDFVLQLDDDDLLDPVLMERGLALFDRWPDVDVAFVGVAGFGEGAAQFDRNQAEALGRLLRRAGHGEAATGPMRFDRHLFGALLHSVPMAFQRPLARRAAWMEVTRLRRRAYGDAHPLAPPLRESEWSLYAAATQRTALLAEPLYRQRCNGQGYFSVPQQRALADRAMLGILTHLSDMSRHDRVFVPWRREIAHARERYHFDLAYHCRGMARLQSLRHLLLAASVRPRVRHLRLLTGLALVRTDEN